MIRENPKIINIAKERIIEIKDEVLIEINGREITRVDMVIVYKRKKKVKEVYVEIKSGYCKKALRKMHEQLEKIKRFVRIKDVTAKVVGVYPKEGSLVDYVVA